MITLTNLSIGPRAMAAPKWWQPAAQPDWAQLDAQIAEMERQVRQYPAKRKEPRMSPSRKKIAAAEVYARRAAQAALPSHRDPICEAACHQVENGASACEATCLALVRDERQLQPDRGRMPRPRSLAEVARAYYANQEDSR
jgi:hypothetical protein